ncbi:MAG: hypothetical protein GXW99_03215 [Clostridiales bacterium]|nr:hypothetical protein [Clostridiales bacterium]
MSKKKEKKEPKPLPLTRWRYFCKTLYSDATRTGEFKFEGVTYLKDDELREIEGKSARVHILLVLILVAVYLTMRSQSIYMVVAGMLAIAVGEVVREHMLPKDILSHLTIPDYEIRKADEIDDMDEEYDEDEEPKTAAEEL